MTSSYNVLQNLDLGLSLNNIYNEQFAIVPDSSPSLFTSTKRVRADSGCYLSDLEFLDSSEDESLLTPPDTKRRCSGVNSAQDCDLFEHYLQNLPCNTRITDTGSFCPLDLFSNTEQRSFSNPQQQEPLQFEDCSIAIESMQQPTYNVSSPPTIGTTVSGLNFDQSSQFKLVISEQPEQYYRARYGSEGVRAPLKGIRDSYPTVQVIGLQNNHGTVVAKLVHEDGSDHTCCSLDSSEDRKNALTKKIGPFNNMSAEFEDLRIKREKKKEGRKNITAPDKSQGKDIRNDKVACILFTATVETSEGNVECSVISHPICLTAAPEPAELDWLEPCRGHFGGKEGIVIKGSKMTSRKCVILSHVFQQ
jgi:hypothetical protein